MDKPKEIKVADEVWIATAQLQEMHPETCCFTPDEILNRVASNKFHDRGVRPGIQWHISLHCVAQKAPNPATLRMLSGCEKSSHTTGRRLYSENSDKCHPLRTGKKEPLLRDIPDNCREEVAGLLKRWHSQEGSNQDNQNIVSPGLPSSPTDEHLGMQVNQIRLQFDIYPFLNKHRAYGIRDKIDQFEFIDTKADGVKRPYGARYKIGSAIQEIKKDEPLYKAFVDQMIETHRTKRQIDKYIHIYEKYVEENEGIRGRRIGMADRLVDKGMPLSESPVDYESDQSIFTEKQIAAIHEYCKDTLSELGFNESFTEDQPKTPNPSYRLIHIENDLYGFLRLYDCTEEITRIKQTKISETTADGLQTDYYSARFVTIQIGHGITVIKALGLYQEFMDYLSIKGKTDLKQGVLDDYTYHYDCNITALDNSPR